MDRESYFRAAQIIKDGPSLDNWTERAYTEVEEKRWRSNDEHFCSSFYASFFPGAEKNCRCQALYKLMNIPEEKPMTPGGVGVVHVGKCIEEQIVEHWHKLGITLGAEYPEQVYVTDEETWLTGYVDAVLDLRPDWYYVLPVEIKSKKNNVIEYMKIGGQSYDEKHYYQLQAYILWCIRNHNKRGWNKLGLMPAQGGIIYYVSREDPRNTHEFYVEMDEAIMREAEEQLKLWKENFINDELPPRPKEWRWTEEPCKWNPYKKLCKQDHKDGVVKLSESNAVKFALEHDPSYNIDKIRKRVTDRWQQKQLKLFD